MNREVKNVWRDVYLKDEYKAKQLEGINRMADAVGQTMGAAGRPVMFCNSFGQSSITLDGITVASQMGFKDEIMQSGADMLRKASSRTVELAGDGTSTAMILARAIVANAMKHISKGVNAVDIKAGIDIAVRNVVNFIEHKAIKVEKDNDKIMHVATVSAHGDKKIGKLIYDCIQMVKKDGHIDVAYSLDAESYVKKVEGSRLNAGYLDKSFVNNPRGECVLLNPYIILADSELSLMAQFNKMMRTTVGQKDNTRPLLLICRLIEGEAMAAIAENIFAGNFQGCIVRPSVNYGKRIEQFNDLSVVLGAKIICDEKGTEMINADASFCGSCDKVVITKTSTVFIKGHGDREKIDKLTADLRESYETEKDLAEKERYRQRLSNIDSGIATFYVGGVTDIEVKERKDRVDDAIKATFAALEEGVCPGGGTTYIAATSAPMGKGINKGQDIGISIVKEALQAPLIQIATNAGQNGQNVVDRVRKHGLGYNAANNSFEDLLAAGILDPAKVLRVALENAASVAGSIFMSNCVIVERYE